jgi:protein-tyrosine-phosphatase
MSDILFVCTGNTCRSPLAEGFARRLARELGTSLSVGSAGTFAVTGEPATLLAIRAGQRRGADLTAHRSRRLTRELLADTRLAVGMTPAHLDAIQYMAPGLRIALATDFLPLEDERHGVAVPDPFGGDEDRYAAVADVLESCVVELVQRWKEQA